MVYRPTGMGAASVADTQAFRSLANLVALGQAVAMIHQSNHWMTRGPQYYGDHLLFQRLYEESQDGIDSLAERAVGAGSPRLVEPRHQVAVLKQQLDQLYPSQSVGTRRMVEISLAAEQAMVKAIANTYGALQQSGHLSHGISNLLEDQADKHEGFIYLLKQRLR